MDIRQAARALGGDVIGRKILAPGPGHGRADRSLAVTFSADAPDGFTVHSFAGDDWQACKDHVRAALGIRRERAPVEFTDRPDLGEAQQEEADKALPSRRSDDEGAIGKGLSLTDAERHVRKLVEDSAPETRQAGVAERGSAAALQAIYGAKDAQKRQEHLVQQTNDILANSLLTVSDARISPKT